jgi:hypothetical protein
MRNNLADQSIIKVLTQITQAMHDVEIVARAGPAKAKLAYLVVGSSLKFVHLCTKEKVT